MPSFDIIVSSPSSTSFRAAQVTGMFDYEHKDKQTFQCKGTIPIEDKSDWNIGLIVGLSGSGKSLIAKHLWPNKIISGFNWKEKCLLDDFPKKLSSQIITKGLNSVGLSSVPVWFRPYKVLSNGEQFRANLARALLTMSFIVYDEFTSVIDRNVAKIASMAISKSVRKNKKQFIAITCHYDIIEWLDPDWIYDTSNHSFSWRCLRRNKIPIRLYRGNRDLWPIFVQYHYLTGTLSHLARRIFLAFINIDDVWCLSGFISFVPAMRKGYWRAHRTVVLPDYQGVGIGNKMWEMAAQYLWETEKIRCCSTTAGKPYIYYRTKHPDKWILKRGPHINVTRKQKERNWGHDKNTLRLRLDQSHKGRLVTSWEYIPQLPGVIYQENISSMVH